MEIPPVPSCLVHVRANPTPHPYPKPSTQTRCLSLPQLDFRGRQQNQKLEDGKTVKGETAEMSIAPSVPGLYSSFTCCPLKLSSSSPSLSHKFARNQRSPASYPRIRALDLDQNTIVAISVGVASVAVGIGIPVFYESQIDNAAKRENTQPCFPCDGSGAQKCRFCLGSGTVTVELGGDEKEVSGCINCDGVGSLTCTTCQGSGIQPRYLDRREFKDDD